MTQTYPMKARVRAEGGTTRVDVYDDIGQGDWFSDGLSAKDFAATLSGVKGPLDVHINSYGGDVDAGIAIGNTIQAHKGFKRTVVDGFACSIASVIAQAGDERVAQPGSMFMIHDALSGCVGNAADMKKAGAALDKHSENIAGIYANRAGGSAQQWREIMQAETWFTAEEAVAAGLADKVGDQGAQLPPNFDLAAFSAIPGRIAARLRSMPQAAAGASHGPFDGTHSHAHPAFGSQGDDATHEHSHSHSGDADHHHSHADAAQDRATALRAAAAAEEHGHSGQPCWDPDGDGDCDRTAQGDTDRDYWTAGGEQKKSVPGHPMADLSEDAIRDLVRAMIRDAASGVDNSPWDASKAWHNGAESDDPAAFYAGICAGEKDGDKATQAAWALPYKYHPGDPVNAAGVKNALARLPQTEGLTNAEQAKATLQKAMKQVSPDYEPEDRAHTDLSGVDLEQIRAALRGATV